MGLVFSWLAIKRVAFPVHGTQGRTRGSDHRQPYPFVCRCMSVSFQNGAYMPRPLPPNRSGIGDLNSEHPVVGCQRIHKDTFSPTVAPIEPLVGSIAR